MIAVLLAALLLSSPGQAGDAGAPDAAVIRGRAVRTDGRPVARVRLVLHPLDRSRSDEFAASDEDGAFEFTGLAPGTYTLTATKTAYLPGEFGQRGAFARGEPIVVTAGQKREHVDVLLRRHAAIVGRIVDADGDGVESASISVLQVRFLDGQRRLVPVASVAPRRTNELGRYRVYGLPPGEYFVRADAGAAGSQDVAGNSPTYFPGTTNPADAQRIKVGDEDVANIDFPLVSVRTAIITGMAVTSSGEPFQDGIQMRPSRRSGAVAIEQVGAGPRGDGGFEFKNVLPGEYVICAFKGVEMAWQYITVTGSDVTDVTIRTSRGSTVAGRVTLDGVAPVRPGDVEIAPVSADPDLAPFVGSLESAQIHDDWTFEIGNVSGPSRLRLLRGPAGWALKAVLVNGVDATDAPLPLEIPGQSLDHVDIVLTDRVTMVTGRVERAQAVAARPLDIVAFATDRALWYPASRFLGRAAAASDGTFALKGLPPGEYFVAALDALPGGDDDGDWRDPALLDAFADRATRVVLSEGQQVIVNPKVTGR